MTMFLVSSNHKKLKEFARFGLDLELRPGDDLPEVEGTPEQVAIYKALMAGPGAIVEDTILVVDNSPWIDIKWNIKHLRQYEGKPVLWQTILAHNDGTDIRLYTGQVHGTIVLPDNIREQAFGFDPFVVPNSQSLSLDELEQQGRKDDFSARRRAVQRLLENAPTSTHPISSIPPWSGPWQGKGPGYEHR